MVTDGKFGITFTEVQKATLKAKMVERVREAYKTQATDWQYVVARVEELPTRHMAKSRIDALSTAFGGKATATGATPIGDGDEGL